MEATARRDEGEGRVGNDSEGGAGMGDGGETTGGRGRCGAKEGNVLALLEVRESQQMRFLSHPPERTQEGCSSHVRMQLTGEPCSPSRERVPVVRLNDRTALSEP